MNQKYAILGILFMSMFMVTTTTNAYASEGFFGKLGNAIGEDLRNLGDNIDEASSDYSEGKDDGERAGVNGRSSECPSTGTAYCAGWSSGYYKGSQAAQTVNANEDD